MEFLKKWKFCDFHQNSATRLKIPQSGDISQLEMTKSSMNRDKHSSTVQSYLNLTGNYMDMTEAWLLRES